MKPKQTFPERVEFKSCAATIYQQQHRKGKRFEVRYYDVDGSLQRLTFPTYPGAGKFAELAVKELGENLQYICLHADRARIREAVTQTQPIAMVHHGGVTDRLFAEGKADQVHDYVKAAKDGGVLAGISAHNPDCIRRVADEGWDVNFFMTCFYFLTRKPGNAEFPTLDIAYPFFKDDPRVMTQVIRQVKQPCLGFKILGAGRLCSSQERMPSSRESWVLAPGSLISLSCGPCRAVTAKAFPAIVPVRRTNT